MRAPSYKGLRDDKPAAEVVREARRGLRRPGRAARPLRPRRCSSRWSGCPRARWRWSIDGRRLKISNWDKVLFPQTGFTKGDLIAYYARVAPAVLPHLRDRAADAQALSQRASTRRTSTRSNRRRTGPSGFRPRGSAASTTRSRQDRPTLVWLANLADIELHTSLALGRPARARRRCWCSISTPGAPAGIVGVLRGGTGAAGLVRQLGLRERGQDLGLEGDAGVRPAQRRPVELRADQAVRAPDRRAARAAAARAGRLADDQAAADGQGAGRLEPERRAQDDRHGLLGQGARAADRVGAGELGRGPGMPGCTRSADADASTPRRCCGGWLPSGDLFASCCSSTGRSFRATRMEVRDGSDPAAKPTARRHRDVEGGDRRAAAADGSRRPRRPDPELRAAARRSAVGERHARERAGDRRSHLGPRPRPARTTIRSSCASSSATRRWRG